MGLKEEIVNFLENIGTDKCLNKANELQSNASNFDALHLRGLGLNAGHIKGISKILIKQEYQNSIRSISFSHNPAIGNEGAIILARVIHKSVCEIGMVDCGISDPGGIELLKSIENLGQLSMICIEQNNFTERIRNRFSQFSRVHPHVMVVF